MPLVWNHSLLGLDYAAAFALLFQNYDWRPLTAKRHEEVILEAGHGAVGSTKRRRRRISILPTQFDLEGGYLKRLPAVSETNGGSRCFPYASQFKFLGSVGFQGIH
jgi:hypothetical protein